MGIKQDLCIYFNDHSFTKIAKKTATMEFEAMLEGVDERLCRAALRALKEHRISFEDSRGASFDSLLCKIKTPFRRDKAATAWHEMAHAVDFIRPDFEERVKRGGARSACYKQVDASSSVVLPSGKTLDDTVREELAECGEALYAEVLARFGKEALDPIGEGVADEYLRANEELKRNRTNRRKYSISRYASVYLTPEERERIIAELREHTLTITEENAFCTYINSINQKPEVLAFCRAYDTVLDMLSGVVDTKHILPGHSRSYMKREGFFGAELFAGLFSSEAVGNERNHLTVRELLPRSYAAYLDLRTAILGE
jgi:hypothetical protein